MRNTESPKFRDPALNISTVCQQVLKNTCHFLQLPNSGIQYDANSLKAPNDRSMIMTANSDIRSQSGFRIAVLYYRKLMIALLNASRIFWCDFSLVRFPSKIQINLNNTKCRECH